MPDVGAPLHHSTRFGARTKRAKLVKRGGNLPRIVDHAGSRGQTSSLESVSFAGVTARSALRPRSSARSPRSICSIQRSGVLAGRQTDPERQGLSQGRLDEVAVPEIFEAI
jgi:hypothetical protein